MSVRLNLRKRLKLSSALAVPIAIGIVISTLISVAITMSTLHDSIYDTYIDTSVEITDGLAKDAVLAAIFRTEDNIKSAADSLVHQTNVSYVAIYDSDGGMIYKAGIASNWIPPSGSINRITGLANESDDFWDFTGMIVSTFQKEQVVQSDVVADDDVL